MIKAFCFFFFSVFVPELLAQKTFQVGPVAGIQGSQLSGDTYQGYHQPGIYAGLFTRWQQKEKLSFQFEIAFSQKGARDIANPAKGDFISYDLRLNYIEVPVFIRPQFRGFTLDFGLSFARLINFSEEDQNGPRIPVRPFRNFEFAGLIGAGYEFNDRISFSVRALRSLLPVREHQSSQRFWWNPGQLNSVLCFAAYYTFSGKEQ